MILNNYYYYFKSAIPPRICDNIIKHALSKSEQLGLIGSYDSKKVSKDDIRDIKRKRNSNIVWLNDNWIYREIHPYVSEANKKAGWNFQWDYSESMQFTKYKFGQHYDWHFDQFEKPKDSDNGRIRKLSVTCQLTDGSEYKGGQLEFDFKNYAPHMRDESKHLRQATEILPKGSIIVFPSFVWHRVKPVTKGVRYSLVMWNLGYQYK